MQCSIQRKVDNTCFYEWAGGWILLTNVQTSTFMTSSHRNALLALCEGNPLVTGGFPHNGPVIRSFDVSFVSLNKLLDKQLSSWWFETARRSCDVTVMSKPWTNNHKGTKDFRNIENIPYGNLLFLVFIMTCISKLHIFLKSTTRGRRQDCHSLTRSLTRSLTIFQLLSIL